MIDQIFSDNEKSPKLGLFLASPARYGIALI
jgi:hypothetical protein